jgi:hypothetical protein
VPEGVAGVGRSSLGVVPPGRRRSPPGIVCGCKRGNKLTDLGSWLVVEALTTGHLGFISEKDESGRSKHSDVYLAPTLEWRLKKGKICLSNITSQDMYMRPVEMSRHL